MVFGLPPPMANGANVTVGGSDTLDDPNIGSDRKRRPGTPAQSSSDSTGVIGRSSEQDIQRMIEEGIRATWEI